MFRDYVELNEEQEMQVSAHVKTKMPLEKAADLKYNVGEYWNEFYSVHQEKYVLLIYGTYRY